MVDEGGGQGRWLTRIDEEKDKDEGGGRCRGK
jgi:hypothetical protein